MLSELNATTWADYCENPIKLFSILYLWLKRALHHVHIHKSKKKHYITFKSTKKKRREKVLHSLYHQARGFIFAVQYKYEHTLYLTQQCHSYYCWALDLQHTITLEFNLAFKWRQYLWHEEEAVTSHANFGCQGRSLVFNFQLHTTYRVYLYNFQLLILLSCSFDSDPPSGISIHTQKEFSAQ